MKTWTGDEWRPVSESEAVYRKTNGFLVREDHEPNDPPGAEKTAAGDQPPAPELPPAPEPKKHTKPVK